MARTALTKTIPPGGYAGAGETLTETAADTSNKNEFTCTGNDLIIAHNTGGSAYTVTINSVDDKYNRSEDITAESIAAGAIHIFGPFPYHGWQQSDGVIHLEASNAAVKFAIVQL